MQNSPSTVSGKSFKCSNTVNSRSRGTDGVIVPNAAHFMYRATLDSAGAADWYFYVDTLFPENGVHPYTKDQYTGAMMPSSATVQAIVPDPMTRIRLLEGVVRGSSGSATSPDSRLADLVTVEERIFDFGMNSSRDIAWKLAQDLVAAPRDAWPGIIARRDAISAAAARALYPLTGLARVTALGIHAHECRDIRFNIQVVAS